jgi:hypothetical protein
MLGVDPAAAGKGLDAVGPLLLGSLSKMSGTPAGADSLFKVIPQDGGSGILGNLGNLLGGMFGGGGQAGGGDMVGSLLGSGSNAIGAALSKALGFNVAPLLGMAAPVLMGILAKTAKAQNLDAAGVASMLSKENAAFLDNPANRDSAALVRSAMDAGNRASDMIASYGADWPKVALGPVGAMFLVSTADLSGPIGSIKEVKAASEAMLAAAKDAAPASVLAAAVGGGIKPSMLTELRAAASTPEQIMDLVKGGVAAVARQSPGELAAYKAAIMSVAQATAEASKEGGFFGIGGTLVSEDEQSALDALEEALA